MVDIHDYDIQCIEHEILWKYDKMWSFTWLVVMSTIE